MHESDAAAAPSLKRKHDKQAKRAAAKSAKKQKRAEFVRSQQQLRQDGEDAEGDQPQMDEAADDTADGSGATHAHGTQKRQGQVSTESLHETDYLTTAGGFRCPFPYWFEFATHAKRRWLGRPLAQVLRFSPQHCRASPAARKALLASASHEACTAFAQRPSTAAARVPSTRRSSASRLQLRLRRMHQPQLQLLSHLLLTSPPTAVL